MPISNITYKKNHRGSQRSSIEVSTFEDAQVTHNRNKLNGKYPPNSLRAMDILSTAAVMTSQQLQLLLPVSGQTLRAYQKKGYILSSPYPDGLDTLLPTTKTKRRIWTLGLVGVARAVDLSLAADSFRGYPYAKVFHDLLLNEIVIQLLLKASENNIAHEWHGTYEGRVRNEEGDVLVEPDAVLMLGEGVEKRGVCVEYHNEDDRRRVLDKIYRYESIQRSQVWRRQWDLSDMPIVAVAATKPIVIQGYIDALIERGHKNTRCRYVAITFKKFSENQQQAHIWSDLNAVAFESERRDHHILVG